MFRVKYISDQSWQGFQKDCVYDAIEIGESSWFVFHETSPFKTHDGRRGYYIYDHKKCFVVLTDTTK